MQSLSLFINKKEYIYFFVSIIVVLLINLSILYQKYLIFKTDEIYHTEAIVKNIYPKQKYNIIKLQTNNFVFFTSYNSNQLKILDKVDIYIVTISVDFISYLKGFYAKSFNLTKITNNNATFWQMMYQKLQNIHTNSHISSLYSALFLGTAIDSATRILCNNFGISHLVALSGFHLGVLSFVLYWVVYLFYNIFYRFFPYRNKKFDILVIVAVCLFSYLILIDFQPSLLRAFVMFVVGIFFLRTNIKLVSFEFLLFVVLLLFALYPRLIFSLSLWFSVAGVFYIFLFIKYFKNLNKIVSIFFFNIWIFFAMNIIVHYFFQIASLYQLYSPVFSVVFVVFYPLSLLLHLVGFGVLFDDMLLQLYHLDIPIYSYTTSLEILILYIVVSLLSVRYKYFFYLLNLIIILFNIRVYLMQ